MSAALYRDVRGRQLEKVRGELGLEDDRLDDAAALLDRLVLGETFEEFLTIPGYALLD
jgi:malate synthase